MVCLLRKKMPELAHVFDTAKAAAKHAAELANTKCKHLYGAQPFTPKTFRAHMRKGRWHWGYLDPAMPGGFSAKVSFLPNGNKPLVRIYYASDVNIRAHEKPREELHTTEDSD